MELPDLPPDITFRRLDLSLGDLDFSFEAKRSAMRPHIVMRWNWDEAFQWEMHRRHYDEKPFFEIQKTGQRLGTLSFQVLPDHVRFGEFYLFPEYQAQGTGSVILAHCLAVADGMNLPVRLEYLLWNPVGSLYRRHGFSEIDRSEIHCLMERAVTLP